MVGSKWFQIENAVIVILQIIIFQQFNWYYPIDIIIKVNLGWTYFWATMFWYDEYKHKGQAVSNYFVYNT